MNKTTGNMYPWTPFSINPIRGRCPHFCTYCYVKTSRVKHLYQGEPYLVNSFFEKRLGKGKTIFMGSCFDLFAEGIPDEWINAILLYLRIDYPYNTYLFQSKNTQNMYQFKSHFPPITIIGTTAETNRNIDNISKAPSTYYRLDWLKRFNGFLKMISIEPLLDFDLDVFLNKIREVEPSFISIGTDSKNHHLPEPPAGKIIELIQELQKFTEVKIKPNLSRLMK